MVWFGLVRFGMARLWSKLVWTDKKQFKMPLVMSFCYFGQIENSFGFSHDLRSQPSHTKTYQTKPYHFRPIFRPFWPIFGSKVPKSKWIWFEDTYPPNQWDVLSSKILVSPFDQFKKHHFGSADMCMVQLTQLCHYLTNQCCLIDPKCIILCICRICVYGSNCVSMEK